MNTKHPAPSEGDSPYSRDKGEKLQKVLANLGWGSRREMERWIEEGRVTLDGAMARLGDRVRPGQKVRLEVGMRKTLKNFS